MSENEEENFLFQAIKQQDWEQVRALMNSELARKMDEYGNTPLHVALGYKAPDHVLLRLIDLYPESTMIHATGNDWLPLHVAAMWGSSSIVLEALIQQYPAALDDPGQGGIKGRTPRHFSDRFPHNKALLERPMDEWEAIIARQKSNNK